MEELYTLRLIKLIVDLFTVQNLTDPLTPATPLALETVASSELTPFSSINTTSKGQEEAITTTTKLETMKGNVVAEIVIKHLTSAQLLMLAARGEAVINFAKSFIQLLEEKDNFKEPKARKATLAVLSFMLPFLVCRLFFSFSGSQSSFNGAIPPPT